MSPGMQDQVVGAHRQRAFYFSAKSLDGFPEKQLIRAGQIYQVIGVDDQRLQVILGPKAKHFVAKGMAEFIRRPLARAGRENL